MSEFIRNKNGFPVLMDAAYGEDKKNQSMDIYLPDIPEHMKREVNVALYIHGGAWYEGDKDGYESYCEDSARKGVVSATMNYRMINPDNDNLLDNPTCFDMLDDIDNAVIFIKNKLESLGIKTKQMMLLGGSAGGHLTLLYSYSRKPVIPVAFCAAQVPPSDFTDTSFLRDDFTMMMCLLSALLGDYITADNYEEKWDILKKASPISYVDTAVPTVLSFGAKDDLVPLSNGVRLDAALTEAGVKHEYIVFENSGHGLDNDPDKLDLTIKKVYEYFDIYFI